MKFIADCMLGSLAKWLRIAGYDTVYRCQIDDRELVRIARAEKRILLTRDITLSKARNVTAILITKDRLDDQLRQVLVVCGWNTARPFTRCPVCNGRLVMVPRSEIADQVPPYVAFTQTRFKRCEVCGKLYWPGTHWEAMQRKLDELKNCELETR